MKRKLQFYLIIFLNFKLFGAQKTEYWINIFVHGSVGLTETFNLKTFRRLVRDKVENSDYERNVSVIRNNPKIFKSQAIQGLGLKQIKPKKLEPIGAYLFASLFDKMLKQYNKNLKNKYYTFGWSGLISYNQRFSEGRIFYTQLKKELERLKNKGYHPKIRIIGYSHGATLIFNFAPLREFEFYKDKFVIDELIAIGMPVLKSTIYNCNHSMFKKIYHFYSCKDIIQQLDIFSPCSLISSHVFSGILPEKLVQIQIKISKAVKSYYNVSKQDRFIDFSPAHYELWFFNSTTKKNPKNNLLYPIPVAIFIPSFIEIWQKQFNHKNHVVFNLLPENQKAIVNTKNKKDNKTLKFLSSKELNCLKNTINLAYNKISQDKIVSFTKQTLITQTN